MSQSAKIALALFSAVLGLAVDIAGWHNTLLATILFIAAGAFFAYWLVDVMRNFFTKWASARSTAWADRDRIELYDAACRMAGKRPDAPFSEQPQRSYHRRLKDAIKDGKLAVLDMRGHEATMTTLVTRDALRAYAKKSRWRELRELLREWDRLNPPKLDSGLPELPSKR